MYHKEKKTLLRLCSDKILKIKIKGQVIKRIPVMKESFHSALLRQLRLNSEI